MVIHLILGKRIIGPVSGIDQISGLYLGETLLDIQGESHVESTLPAYGGYKVRALGHDNPLNGLLRYLGPECEGGDNEILVPGIERQFDRGVVKFARLKQPQRPIVRSAPIAGRAVPDGGGQPARRGFR